MYIMKSFGSACIALLGASVILAQDADVGTGPYPAVCSIYQPVGSRIEHANIA
jgi:hypothetical protein